MKTSKQLIAEVDAELNAVKAADMGLEAAQAFAQEALNQHSAGDVIKTKDALDNLLSLLVELRKAVPANVTPASAGPVGKSPKEHLVEQAHDAAIEALGRMREALTTTGKAIEEAQAIISTAKAVPAE